MSAILVVGKVVSCVTRDVQIKNGDRFKEHRIFIVNGNSSPIEVKSNVAPRSPDEKVQIPVWVKTWVSKAGNYGWELREQKPKAAAS